MTVEELLVRLEKRKSKIRKYVRYRDCLINELKNSENEIDEIEVMKMRMTIHQKNEELELLDKVTKEIRTEIRLESLGF